MKRLITTASLVALAACGSDSKTSANNSNDVLPAGNYAVVITSDYTSTAVSLLDLDAQTVAQDECITSGTKLGSISTTLSGDVVLPSQAQANP